MRALVTGGAGFIGSHLSRRLVEAGHEVVVLDNLRRGSTAAAPAGARVIEGDVRDALSLADALPGCDTVFHLAAQSNVMGAVADLDYSFSTNVTGTVNVLRAASDAGVRTVVFASSREVYGDQRVLPVAEGACTAPRNAYGASKVAGEVYCRSWPESTGMRCAVLRLANVYGPGDRDRVIPLWLERAARREPITVYGGQQVLDFIHVELVVEALVRAAATPLPGPVNVGSGKGTPLPALAERIGALAGRHLLLEVEPARGPEVTRFVADVTRMQSLLGIEPPADPLHGLAALWEQAPARGQPAGETPPAAEPPSRARLERENETRRRTEAPRVRGRG
jgi:UDP-glucose 4-epimerase